MFSLLTRKRSSSKRKPQLHRHEHLAQIVAAQVDEHQTFPRETRLELMGEVKRVLDEAAVVGGEVGLEWSSPAGDLVVVGSAQPISAKGEADLFSVLIGGRMPHRV